MSLTDTVPDGDGLVCEQLFVCVLNLIQRLSSCITASVVKTTLPGLRRFVVKTTIIFENSLRLCRQKFSPRSSFVSSSNSQIEKHCRAIDFA